jgi:hypothetical protein
MRLRGSHLVFTGLFILVRGLKEDRKKHPLLAHGFPSTTKPRLAQFLKWTR